MDHKQLERANQIEAEIKRSERHRDDLCNMTSKERKDLWFSLSYGNGSRKETVFDSSDGDTRLISDLMVSLLTIRIETLSKEFEAI